MQRQLKSTLRCAFLFAIEARIEFTQSAHALMTAQILLNYPEYPSVGHVEIVDIVVSLHSTFTFRWRIIQMMQCIAR